ncbi:hypothetical protein, partial [Roseibium sp.]|uniref:hypothetical protein n=1 Tax=Roseibium sp. TaxID=1936156 RepID=UPI003D0EC785
RSSDLCPDLPEWEQIGASLEVSGRGEPLPHAVSEHHPANICETLCRLTELCVEVGLVDMYGALTRQPDRFLDACLTLLEEHRIEPPGLEPLVSLTDNTNGWGEPVSDATFRSFVAGLNLDFLPRDTES